MNDITRPGPVSGARHALAGFRLIRAPGVRRYVAVPLLINVVLFVVALTALGNAVDYAVETWLGDWPDWLRGIVWFLFAVLSAVIVFFSFTIVANIVASPFNGMLAEAVERHLNPALPPMDTSWARMLRGLQRSLWAELRKLIYIGLRALPLLVLSVIPGLNAVAPLLWLMFGAWMLCLEYLDCPLGNHGSFFPRVVTEMRARRGMSLGFGLTVTVLTLIPVINFIAMPVGVAGATSLYCAYLGAGPGAAPAASGQNA